MPVFKKLLILLLLPLCALTAHKYYMSLIKVEYKTAQKSVQITQRIFIDDLENTLNTVYKKQLELALPEESKDIDSLVQKYVSEHFFIKINEEQRSYQYLGKEYKDDVVYIYLEISNINNISVIEVKNTMLFEKFPDQKNIVKLLLNDIKKTFILTPGKEKDLFQF